MTAFRVWRKHGITLSMNIILFDELPPDGFLPISDERAKHMRKVLKVTPGERVRIGLVNGPAGYGQVLEVREEGIRFSWEPGEVEKPMLPVELVVAQVRPICMKRILREAVSLGVRKIHVVGADTAEKSYGEAHLWTRGEYRSYLLHGAQQAVSTCIPECLLYPGVGSLDLGSDMTRLLLDNIEPEGDIMEVPFSGPVVLAIGPERGWSDRERDLFRAMGFRVIGMGERVLRTETACSAGLGIVTGRLRTRS